MGSIKHRSVLPNGTLSGTTTVMAGSVTTGEGSTPDTQTLTVTTYEMPQLSVDPAGGIHIAALRSSTTHEVNPTIVIGGQ